MRTLIQTLTQQSLHCVVQLNGWVHAIRNHGGVIFLDLRDHTGLIQMVAHTEVPEVFEKAQTLRKEYVIQAVGQIMPRETSTINAQQPQGHLEIHLSQIDVLSISESLPFDLGDDDLPREDIRMKYRYLDLRRPRMQKNMRFRAKGNRIIRQFLDLNDFVELETPILTKPTPEGARDYLIPSRTHPGCHFALPQSPQLFKQLLMVGGMDRYYQIARCFRDEDLRADRQPEFTQLDLEVSFMSELALQSYVESLMRCLFEQMLEVQLPDPFPRLTYEQAMQGYGSDKPNLQSDLKCCDVTDKMPRSDLLKPHMRAVALRLPNKTMTRKQIDERVQEAIQMGAKGLAYIKCDGHLIKSSLDKFYDATVLQSVAQATGAQPGDWIWLLMDEAPKVYLWMGAIRSHYIAEYPNGHPWAMHWVTDFPMFEKTDTGQWTPMHHPFTAPRIQDEIYLETDPQRCLSRAYDLVLNGVELGGGSVRIVDSVLQQKIFQLIGLDPDVARQKFGFLLEALSYGAPPHAGIAIGLDRLWMLMLKQSSIRDVIAFPKTQTASCLLTNAPA